MKELYDGQSRDRQHFRIEVVDYQLGQWLAGDSSKSETMLTLREGKLTLTGVSRTRARAIQSLYDFVMGFPRVSEIVVSYSTDREDAESLAARLKAQFPDIPFYLTRIGPVLGTHAGPGAMGVAVRVKEDEYSRAYCEFDVFATYMSNSTTATSYRL